MKDEEKTKEQLIDELINLRKQLEFTKRSSQLRLQTILDALPVGIFISDCQGKVLQTNGLAQEIWGGNSIPPSRIAECWSRRGWWAETGEPVEDQDWALARAITKGETSKEEVINIQRLDGTKGTILNYAAPFINDRDEIEGAVVVLQDVTKRQLINGLLKRALGDLSIEEFVKMTLDVITSLPFLEKKGIIYLVESGMFALKALTGLDEEGLLKEIPVSGCLCRKLDEQNQVQFIDEQPCIYLVDIGFSKNLCIPVIKGKSLLGIICLSQRDGYPQSQVDREFFIAVADALASFISRKQAEEAIKKHSDHLEVMVTERTKALQRANKRISNILESITDGFYALNNQLNFVYINKEAKRILAKSNRNLIGKGIWEEFPKIPIFVENLYKAIELKQSVHFDYFCINVKRWLEMHFYPSDDGLSAYFRDITERKQTEDKILQLAAIVESSSDGIMSCSRNGSILSWNKAAEDIYGYQAEEILGQNILNLVPSEQLKHMKKMLVELLKGEAISQYDISFIKKDGSIAFICFSASPIKDSKGETEQISIITRDITERSRFEKEMSRIARLDLVGQMSASIGHEVRNPMTTVRGFLQMLGEKETDAGKKEYYELMIDELDRANAIITEFLSLARDKVSKLEDKCINGILESLYRLILADAINQDKSIEIDKGIVPVIPLDEKEIRQLILNLVRNGLEAMSPGGKLIIKTFKDNDELVLSVQDQGEGISPEILDNLGTPFITTKSQGTGLGLAVCYSIVGRHNARIDVKTGFSGTVFEVRFKIPAAVEGGVP